MADNLFANYEQDFRDVFGSLESHLRAIPNLSNEQKLSEIRKAENDITDAEDILQSMNLNARNVSGLQGQKLSQKIKEYEAKVAASKKELRRMETTVTSMVEREALMGGGAVLGVELTTSVDQRERLISGTERLHRSNQTLLDARRTAEATVETGSNILSNLESQRETMERSLGRLGEINSKLAQSSRILSAMARRVATNKLIMAGIVIVLVGAIALIIWLKWFNK